MSRTIDADKYKEDLWVGREYMDEDTLLTATNILDCQPTIEAVPLADIYRVIAGHSNYHGDAILAALTCIAEGKQVNPVKPIEAEPVQYGRWIKSNYKIMCSRCKEEPVYANLEGYILTKRCPNCGANMLKEVENGTTD